MNRPRWPMGLLGAVAIIVAAELFVARHWVDFTGSHALSWTLSEQAAGREARTARVLCFGDSLMKHGLLPDVLGPRLGTTVTNLSATAAQAPTSFYLLKRSLDAGARPEAIIVDFMPDLLAGGLPDAARQWPELLTFAETVELARSGRDFTFLVRTTIDRGIRSRRSRPEIRAGVSSALRGEVNPIRVTNLTLSRNWTLHGGAQFSQDNPGFDGQATSNAHDRPMSDRFWCNGVNRDYLDKFFNLARSRGIPVYWVLPPASPALQLRREAGGGDASYTAFVRDVVSRHPGAVVLDARQSGFDHTRFVDPIHLSGKGAIALSTAVADAISSRRMAWIDLPSCPDRPLPVPLEDLEQSRVVVLSQRSSRDRR